MGCPKKEYFVSFQNKEIIALKIVLHCSDRMFIDDDNVHQCLEIFKYCVNNVLSIYLKFSVSI